MNISSLVANMKQFAKRQKTAYWESQPNKKQGWLILLACFAILAIASYTRLWNIPNSLEFLGDQGRDALLVRRVFAELNPVFIGPVTSVGNMYLGPLYYYFMMPFLMLSYPSPVGPAYAVAVLSIITTGLLIFLGKKMIGLPASIIAAGLFATHAVVIQYSRFSWNPNPAPFAALLMVYWTYLAWYKNHTYWLLVAAAFSVLIQLHYITLLSAAGAGVIFLIQAIESWRGKKYFITNKTKPVSLKKLLQIIPLGIGVVVLSLTPLILFDIKNGNLNQRAFQNLIITEDAFKVSKDPWYINIQKSLAETQGRSIHLLGELSFGENRKINSTLAVIFLLTMIFAIVKEKSSKKHGYIVLFSFVITGILGTSFYRGSLFNHYISYLFPIILMGWAVCCITWYKIHKIALIPIAILISFFLFHNIPLWNLSDTGWSIHDMKRTSERIAEDLDPNTPYTLVLLTGTGDLHGMNYRYFLTTLGLKPLGFEDIEKAQQLVIINEDQPYFEITETAINEIQIFPSTIPEIHYTIEGGPEIIILRR